MKKPIVLMILCGIVLGIPACKRQPEPLRYGLDDCTQCMMQIEHRQFGAELITSKGKVYKFDSMECLAAFSESHSDIASDGSSLWTVDYADPGRWIPVGEAVFLHCEDIPSPMGLSLSGFSDRTEAAQALADRQGRVMTWQGLLEFVKRERSHPRMSMDGQ